MASTFEVERQLANAGYLPQGVDFSPRFTPPADIEGVIRGAAGRYGLNPDDAVAVARLESGLNPRAQNPGSSAGGLFQFVNSTWNQYGGGDKYDPARNADAGARYLRDVRDTMARGLGRAPTVGELYLGHQQGASGALRILQNPDGLAREAVGPDVVVLNGGTIDMTNRDFASRWDRRAARAADQAPGILDTLGAAARQGMGLVGMLGYGMPFHSGQDDPAFNPITTADADPALRPYLSEFVDVRNRDEYDRAAERIRRATEDRETLAAAGPFGTIAAVAAGILDPINLIPIGGGLWKALKVGRFAEGALTGLAAGAGGAALQEALLQQADPTRTAEEAGLNVVAGALGGAGLGVGAVVASGSASRLARAGILGAGGATGGAAAGLAEAVYSGQGFGDGLATVGTSAVIGGLLGGSVGALARPGRTGRDVLHDIARNVDIETEIGNGAVYSDIRQQLLGAGRVEAEADAGGKLWQAHVDAMARATGMKQDEVYRLIRPEVRTGEIALPMDDASRNERAIAQGWSEETYYHGTREAFDEFRRTTIGSATDKGWFGEGFYFTRNPEAASGYADRHSAAEGANVLPVRLRMKNPLVIDPWSSDEAIAASEKRLAALGVDANLGNVTPAELTERAKAAGYDSIIVGDGDKNTEYVVFDPEQVRSKFAKFDPEKAGSADLLAQSARDLPMDEASRMARAREMGFTGPWYHGTERLDRLTGGGKIKKSRATSGPMPYFTDDASIASNYAANKSDTSLPDDGDISRFFTVSAKSFGERGAPITVERSWNLLTREQRNSIAELATRVGYKDVDNGEGPFVVHKDGVNAIPSNKEHYSYLVRENRGNHLAALRELWHDGGYLIGEEGELAKIYRLAGYPHEISDASAPWVTANGILPAMLRMKNPLVTSNTEEILGKIVPALQDAFKNDRTRLKQGADMWAKESRFTPKQWVEQLKSDIESGENSYVFTSIPDKVTRQLEILGYDGILDVGGKGGGDGHRVAIPFSPEQVRSAFAKFDPTRIDSADLLAQDARGTVEFRDDVTRITLGAKADASTFLHESGHVFLRNLDRLAAQSPELSADMAKVREWLGNDGGEITRDQHEQWARGFEAYLRDGKAPNSALREVFERFRDWLTAIYRSLADLDVDLSDDVREVMDRIIGIDDDPSARPSGPDSLSAASMPQATMEDLRIGRGVEPLARIQSRIPIVGGPDLVLATSPVRSARWAMRKLMRPALATVGDLAGRAEVVTENVESAAGQWHGTEVAAKQRATAAYTEYAKAAAAAGEPVLKRDDILNAASQAGRRGDSGAKLALGPEAQKAAASMARIYREEVIDPLLQQALEHGLLTQAQVDKARRFAASYMPRVWNIPKIIEKRTQFTNEVVMPQVVRDWEEARAKLAQVRQTTRFADAQLRQIESAGIEHGGAEAAAFIADGPERTPSQIMRENVKALQAALDDASVQWAAGDEARARDLVAIARTPKIARDGMEGIRKGGPALKAEEAQEVQDILLRTRGLRPTDDADIGVRATRAVEAMRERVTVLEDAAKYASEHADATRPNAAISRAAARLKELDAQIGEAERAAGRTSESMRDLGGPGAAKAEVDAWTRYQTLIDERRRVDIRAALLKAADVRLRSEAAEAAGDLAAKLKSDAETARAIADQYDTALKKSLHERTKAYRVLDAEDNIGRLDEEDLPGVASDIVEALIGHTNNRVQYEALKVQARGALKEKTFNVRDERVDGGNGGENWLENDIELLAQRYVRTLAPDIELKRLTGDVNAEPLRQQIIQEYTDRANAMADGRAKTKLDKRQKRDLEAFDGVVARLRGTYGLPTNGAEAWALRAARLAKAYNISRLMGWGWVSQLSDAGRIIFRSGMIRFMGDAVMPMVSNWEAVRMTKRELQLADVATELVRSSMALRGGELFDDYARTSLVEQTAQKIAAGSVRLFGLDHWNQGAKTISGMIAQHTLVDGVRKLASGAEMKSVEIADLSRVGIGAREAEFLLPFIDKFGRDVRGVYIPNSADWDGAGAVDAARLWRGALRQVVDDMVINPGQDRALGMSRPGLSVLTQLETFNLVSTQRTILAGFQRRNAGVLIGSAVMIGLGMLSYWLKAKISEMAFGSTSTWKMPSSPGEWLVQGVNGSGLLGVIGSLDQRLLASTSGALGSDALAGSPTRSRFASADITALFGPTASALGTAYTSAQAIGRGDWGWRDTHRARSLLLLQNYFALRGLFDQAEIELNDLLGVRQRPPRRQ